MCNITLGNTFSSTVALSFPGTEINLKIAIEIQKSGSISLLLLEIMKCPAFNYADRIIRVFKYAFKVLYWAQLGQGTEWDAPSGFISEIILIRTYFEHCDCNFFFFCRKMLTWEIFTSSYVKEKSTQIMCHLSNSGETLSVLIWRWARKAAQQQIDL